MGLRFTEINRKELSQLPKSVSVYLPNKLVERLNKFPELNLSELCRMGIELYLDTREIEGKALIRIENLEKRVDESGTSLSELDNWMKAYLASFERRMCKLEQTMETTA